MQRVKDEKKKCIFEDLPWDYYPDELPLGHR